MGLLSYIKGVLAVNAIEVSDADDDMLNDIHHKLCDKLIKHVYYKSVHMIKLGKGKNDSYADVCITRNGVEFFNPVTNETKQCDSANVAVGLLLNSIGLSEIKCEEKTND